MRKRLLLTTLTISLLSSAIIGCGSSDNSATDLATTTIANETTTNEITTSETTTEPPTTTEEPTTIAYADWIDTLHKQMIDLNFDSVIATISDSNFLSKCKGYECSKVSNAYENECFKLPISSGGVIGIVKTNSEITVFYCADNTEKHKEHDQGFGFIGYGDIAASYSKEGVVTFDGVHLRSTKPSQGSFDLEPDPGIWMVWAV